MQLVSYWWLSFGDMYVDIDLIQDTGTVHLMLLPKYPQDTQPINITTQTHEPERNIDA